MRRCANCRGTQQAYNIRVKRQNEPKKDKTWQQQEKNDRPDRRPRLYPAAHHFTCAGANRRRAEELVTIHDTVNLEIEVDGMKGALAEARNSLVGDEASSEWEVERHKREPTNSGTNRC